MIVISGALVLVALVLLVIGLVDPSLGFVYASIAVSLASFVFLVVGILQRRKEVLPDAEGVAEVPAAPAGEGITAIIPATTGPVAAVPAEEPAAAPVAEQREEVSGQVLVVAGRPRYHVAGCRYLTGKDAESVDVADAREEGFTACGVCKPDLALAAAEEPAAGVAQTEPAQVDEVVEAPEAAVPARVAKAPAKAAVKKAAARTAPAKAKAPVKAAKAPAKAAVAAPAKASPAKAAAATATKRGGVIVIPERGKFHAPDCRYVRGAEGTLELTKAQATKQGYTACGVCNP